MTVPSEMNLRSCAQSCGNGSSVQSVVSPDQHFDYPQFGSHVISAASCKYALLTTNQDENYRSKPWGGLSGANPAAA